MALNVLHISPSDARGGSARSAFRLHSALRKRGERSRMLVGEKQTEDPDVRPLKRNLAWRAADRAFGAATDATDLQYVLYPSSFALARDRWFLEAHVLQLHNLHGGYFSASALPFLSRRRPTVWRLSDMWGLTGHVAYSYDCERWRTGCGQCPYLAEYPPLRRDTTALLWRWKDRLYARSRLTLVAPSRWLERLTRESPLLRRFAVRRIPNGADLVRFRPRERRAARARIDLDPGPLLVLFAAPDLGDRRKGGRELAEALALLADLDFAVAVAGLFEPPALPRPARALGLLGDEELACAYAAADLFVLPSLADNLPNAVLESMACGTPCVAFDVGGVPDTVRHLETGYLAPAGDPKALAEGIRALLGDAELRARLGRRAREVAEREFSSELEAQRFAELYAELLEAP